MDLSFLVPERLLAEYEPISLLKEGQRRQTLLLRRRDGGTQAVLKRSQDSQEDLVEDLI